MNKWIKWIKNKTVYLFNITVFTVFFMKCSLGELFFFFFFNIKKNRTIPKRWMVAYNYIYILCIVYLIYTFHTVFTFCAETDHSFPHGFRGSAGYWDGHLNCSAERWNHVQTTFIFIYFFTSFSSSFFSLIILSSSLLNIWFKILDNFVLWVYQAQMLQLQTSWVWL